MKLTTTFQLMKQNYACTPGYKKLANHLGGVRKYGKNTPINLLTILESNGIADCIWCLRATVEDSTPISIELAVYVAELVLPIFERVCPNDNRPRKAVELAKSGTVYSAATADDVRAAYLEASCAALGYYAAHAADAAGYAYSCAYSCDDYYTVCPLRYAYHAVKHAYRAAEENPEIKEKIKQKLVELLQGE